MSRQLSGVRLSAPCAPDGRILIANIPPTDAGKRVAYVYRAQRAIQGSKIRVIWVRVPIPPSKSTEDKKLTQTTGQGHPPPRQLRRRPRQVQEQPASQVLRCLRPRHAVPFFDISFSDNHFLARNGNERSKNKAMVAMDD